MGLSVQYTETFETTFKILTDFLRKNWGDKAVTGFVPSAESGQSLLTKDNKVYLRIEY